MGLAVAAVVVGLASLALIAWDQIFNDGALLRRFEEWLGGVGWIQAIAKWDSEVLTPLSPRLGRRPSSYSERSSSAHSSLPGTQPATSSACRLGHLLHRDDPRRIPGRMAIPSWHLPNAFIGPFITPWNATRDFFLGSFTAAWEKAVSIFRQACFQPLYHDLACNKGLLPRELRRLLYQDHPRNLHRRMERCPGHLPAGIHRSILSPFGMPQARFLPAGSFARFFTRDYSRSVSGRMGECRHRHLPEPPLSARSSPIMVSLRDDFFGHDFFQFFAQTIPGMSSGMPGSSYASSSSVPPTASSGY